LIRSRLIGFAAAFAALGAIWFVVPAHSDGGVVTFTSAPSGPIEAAGPGGATAGYTATAVDSLGAAEAITCTGPGGTSDPSGTLSVSATFPIATTTVTCTGADGATNSIAVTVQDTTPPTVSNPGNLTAEATNASGAPVSFSVSAQDIADPSPSVSCAPASGSTFPLGTTNVTCTAQDKSGNSASTSFTITVHDTTPPTLQSVPGNQTVEATSSAGAPVSFSLPTAGDSVDPAPTVTCSPGSGSTFSLGTTTVTCTAKDASNNSSSQAFTVTVRDTTPPALQSVPGNRTAEATSAAGASVSFPLPTATDAVDSTPTVTCSPGSGSTFQLGTTTVRCTARDDSNNSSSQTFTVTVRDTTPPTITKPADQTAEATSATGAKVSFSPTARDAVDASPSVTCTPASGSTFPLGSTTVGCTAQDDAGNRSSTSFKVTVVDTTAPTLSNPGNQNAEATGPAGAAVTFALSARDAVDASPSVKCAPKSSGDTFPLGQTNVTCTAQDNAGNKTSQSFNVTVVDTTPPTLTSHDDMQREANSPQGSVVLFSSPTAVDLVDGPIATVACTPASGSVFPLGATRVTCAASDSHGNKSSKSFTVRVVDTTPPVLVPPGDRTYVAPTAAGEPSSFFTRLARATDIADPHPVIFSNAPDIAPIGTTVVTFTARDASGNHASGSSEITVLPPGSAVPQTAAPDRTPPDDVTGLTAKAGDRVVVLNWKLPKAPDFGSVVVTRAPADGSGPGKVVYRGSGTSFTDRGVKNGVDYRYVVVALDKSGNASAGAVAVALPKASLLRAPRDGARLRVSAKPPTFRWVAAPSATYYNVQLFAATTKILSAWPVKNSYTLKRTWKYNGRRYRLSPGTYTWYVWPGIGARADVHYGELLGSASFTIVR
jgi:large repetitive protein